MRTAKKFGRRRLLRRSELQLKTMRCWEAGAAEPWSGRYRKKTETLFSRRQDKYCNGRSGGVIDLLLEARACTLPVVYGPVSVVPSRPEPASPLSISPISFRLLDVSHTAQAIQAPTATDSIRDNNPVIADEYLLV